jgi:hypothetical protein
MHQRKIFIVIGGFLAIQAIVILISLISTTQVGGEKGNQGPANERLISLNSDSSRNAVVPFDKTPAPSDFSKTTNHTRIP